MERDEKGLLAALRVGDEDAFLELVERYHAQMVRLACSWVGERESAEEVAQEAWLGALRGLDRFEERSSLKTWLFSILVNRARTRARQEGRRVDRDSSDAAGPGWRAVDPDRFVVSSTASEHGHWLSQPGRWSRTAEDLVLSNELRQVVERAIETLPPRQRSVITLRDLEGWSSLEVRNVLELTETNQRVLLHRARATIRRALEGYLDR